MVKTETRKFSLHEEFLLKVIRGQAGTLQKATLEGVMNAVEAGSDIVDISLKIDNDNIAVLSISDCGKGIENKEEIEEFFEKFGTPHSDNEKTIWKKYRLGRGQMFTFGRNVWRTSTFQMIVDLNKNGLSYELQENLPFVPGCKIEIELYQNPIGYNYNSIESYKEMLSEQVKFIEKTIIFNGEQINTPASSCNWDFEDENAYYLFNMGTDFLVYNLGAFVMKPSLHEMGMTGVVVSKKVLDLNVSRNDVNYNCVIYNQIKDVVKSNRITKTRQPRRTLNSWERISTLRDVRDSTQSIDDVKTLSLIPTSQNKYISLNSIKNMKQQWCFAPLGDRYADRIMEKEQAVCISDSIITDLGYTGLKKMFFVWLTSSENKYRYGNNEWENVANLYFDFEKLKEGISDSFSIIPNKKYTASERRIISVLQGYGCWEGRRILLGYSESCSAWTDGSTFIAIDRNWLKSKYMRSGSDIGRVMMLLTHEMAHDSDSRQTHIHGPEFYENMVRILESYDSPISNCAYFKDTMISSKIEERRRKEEEKRKKAQEKVNSKLGIAASVK